MPSLHPRRFCVENFIDNPTTWGTFWNAAQFYRGWHGREHSHKGAGGKILTGRVMGLGFVLTADDPFVGIDLDNCFTEEGKILPWAQEIVEMIDSYTEVSPSGTGIRIFVKGKLPGEHCRTGNIEMYQQGRYLTVTGRVLQSFEVVKYAQ